MSVKLFQDLLDSFKRSNKERKLKLAIKAGFSTPEQYKAYLEKQILDSVVFVDENVKVSKELTKEERYLTDMVIAFDTTGSMSSYLKAVKEHVISLIPKLFKQNPGLNLSIVAFGDYCDMLSPSVFGRAYQIINLTNNEKSLIDFVRTAQNTSGGDSDEFYELVIKKIVEETTWREGSNKSVLFIADDSPHEIGYSYRQICVDNQIDWRKEAQKATLQDIQFDTLRINPRVKWYEELSQITNGVCLNFDKSQKTADLIEIANLSRGGVTTRAEFYSKMESNTDSDLKETFAMYKTIVEK